ncbi:MAG TPA: hypothetical protein DD381_04450 [Lentisphaeria bacterium]|nr:MAG: hypothetical protein A2X47_07200 [Lentisphaerae bacterium GWF2_38_69]HBM15583.1 hypothetical protein [Lentisphaeria bacterium]
MTLLNSFLSQNAFLKHLIIFIVFCILISLAFLTRTYDCARESVKYPDFMPFTLECAMMYSYSYDIAKNGSIPKYDSSLVATADIPAAAQMSISLEYFLGYGYRIKEFTENLLFNKELSFEPNNLTYNINTDFVKWLRLQLRLWISLSSGIIFIWLLLLDTSLLFSFLGGLIFAVTPAAIARATGQDIIRENFAIPLILISFLCYYLYLKYPGWIKLLLLSFFAFLAIVSWDMTILCFSLWGIYEFFLTLFSSSHEKNKLLPWLAFFAVSMLSGLINPYLTQHNFLCSPFVSVIAPVLIVALIIKDKAPKIKISVNFISIIFFTASWFLIIKDLGFGENYSHFYSLILAKLKFLNLHPIDPSLLDFDSRILWTPALHSATLTIYWSLFHFIVPSLLLLLLISILFKNCRKSLNSRIVLPIVFSIFFLILFLFMARFHALAIPFICLSIALLANNLSICFGKNQTVKYILSIAIIILIIAETYFFLNMERVYNDNSKAQISLIKELNPNSVKDKVILSDFTLSPMLKAYCGAKIILQPKFELKETRDAVKDYLYIMFHGNEEELINFCKKYKTDYFIYDTAMMNGSRIEYILHPWSSRYIANARFIDEKAPVYLFYYTPEKLTYFYKMDESNQKEQDRFVVFKTIYPEDIIKARQLFKEAEKSNTAEKKKLIKEAFDLNPASPEIRYYYYKINNDKWPQYTL